METNNGAIDLCELDKLDYINHRIQQEFCHDTIEQLSDVNLLSEYMKSNSVQNEIVKLGNILDKYVDEEKKQQIIQNYILELIPPGTKGVIRGNKFNKIVQHFIHNLALDVGRFEYCFEKKHELHMTSEIPDWYIFEKNTNKIIIGMNQLDLISGGHQLNRGYKYLVDNKHNTEQSKLLCVISNHTQFKRNKNNSKNKAYILFETGFKNNTLCYLKNLKNIITKFFR
jgi:hypothetical protein